jgi:hypothetical protein
VAGSRPVVSSPQKARTGVFQHVAGTYDGHTLALYVDGIAVKSQVAEGTLVPGAGPLLIGNDASERRFSGLIDQVRFDGRALPATSCSRLTCLSEPGRRWS